MSGSTGIAIGIGGKRRSFLRFDKAVVWVLVVAIVLGVLSAESADAATRTVQAEGLQLTTGAGQVTSDVSASGGQALLIWSDGEARGTLNSPGPARLTVRAKGDQCAGAPQMTVRVGSTKALEVFVSATVWTDYQTDLALPAGNYPLSVSFGNDYAAGCDRNLHVDVIRLATSTSPPSPSSTVEAEQGSLTAGAGQTFADNVASGGRAVVLWAPGRLTITTSTPAAKRLVVRAKGDQCAGAPRMTVEMDGTTVLTTSVAATAWSDFGVNAGVAAGRHTFTIAFDNDHTNGCDRNLRVDKISLSTTTSTGKWNTYKGFNFQSWNSDTYSRPEASTSFAQMAATGVNSVSVNAIWFQDSGTSNVMRRDANYTPTDAGVVTTIRRAESAGMKTMVRPMVNTTGNVTWRGHLDPSNVAEWFTNYRRMVNHYATIAQQNGVDLLDIGSEFNSLERHSTEWRRVVSEARGIYKGSIVYSVNWDSFSNPVWLDAVDIIGVDAYFPLSNGPTPSVTDIANRWASYPEGAGPSRTIIPSLAALHQRFGKPVVFTEVGYRSGTSPLREPWLTGGTYSPEEQQRAIEALLRAWDDKPWFHGMFIWYWNADPNAGGPGDTDHTVQRKPAEETVRARYTST